MDRASAVFRAGDIECYSASCALLAAADLRPHLASFRMPVTIVVGEEDHATPVAMARRLHEGIPQSTLTILPEARHLTPIECPQPDRVGAPCAVAAHVTSDARRSPERLALQFSG